MTRKKPEYLTNPRYAIFGKLAALEYHIESVEHHHRGLRRNLKEIEGLMRDIDKLYISGKYAVEMSEKP